LKDLYYENHKTVEKKIKKTPENGKTSHAHGLAELIS
jgi:hypothetical protein